MRHDGGGGHQSIAQFDAIKDQGDCIKWFEQRICNDWLETWIYSCKSRNSKSL